MIASPSTAKTVKDRGKPISYLDSSSKNTSKEFISIIKMRWFGLKLKFYFFLKFPKLGTFYAEIVTVRDKPTSYLDST
jgi:hypothetical protein